MNIHVNGVVRLFFAFSLFLCEVAKFLTRTALVVPRKSRNARPQWWKFQMWWKFQICATSFCNVSLQRGPLRYDSCSLGFGNGFRNGLSFIIIRSVGSAWLQCRNFVLEDLKIGAATVACGDLIFSIRAREHFTQNLGISQ